MYSCTGMPPNWQYGTTTGVTDNGKVIPDLDHLLARQFSQNGYRTVYIGKWHIFSAWTEPVPEGERGEYEYWRIVNSPELTSQSYEGFVYDEVGNRIPFAKYRVDAMNDLMIKFLREKREDPFFLSYLEPHHENDLRAYVAPDGYEWRYRNPYAPPDLLANTENWMESLPGYYGCCARIDESVGLLLSELEAQDILDGQ